MSAGGLPFPFRNPFDLRQIDSAVRVHGPVLMGEPSERARVLYRARDELLIVQAISSLRRDIRRTGAGPILSAPLV